MKPAALGAAAFLAVAPAAAQVPAAGNGVAASVVYVQVFRAPYDWSQPWRQEPVSGVSGSGFLIDGGRILTNGHVIADARQVLVRRPDQASPYVATVEAAGDDCDLAVLRVADPAFARGLRPLAFGPLPRAGTRVNTYGFPLGGQDVSSTAGIVSRIESRGYVHSGADAHLVVQTDAAINPGNSGGPLLDSQGNVVGVNTAIYGPGGNIGIGFAMPINRAKQLMDGYQSGRKFEPPRLGVSGVFIAGDVAVALELPSEGGFLVDEIERGSSAEAAGLRGARRYVIIGNTEVGIGGDLILAVDGQAVDSSRALNRIISRKRPGDKAELTLFRGGRRVTLTVRLGVSGSETL